MFFHCDQLIKSMYSEFMGDWLGAYPREDVLVLRLEDYRDPKQRRSQLALVFRHLLLSEPTEEQWREMLAKPVAREHKGTTQIHPDAKRLLRSFYEPFNKDLAKLLGDPRFEWAEEAAPEGQAQEEEALARRRGAARRTLVAAAGAFGGRNGAGAADGDAGGFEGAAVVEGSNPAY